MSSSGEGENGRANLVDDLLYEPEEGHLSSEDALRYADGSLSEERLREVAAHLDGCRPCRELLDMARAGLEESAAVELSAALRRTGGAGWVAATAGRDADASDASFAHRVVAIPLPPRPRAMAAQGLEPLRVPEDRVVLAEEPGRHKIVYHRVGRQAVITLTMISGEEPEELECGLDGSKVPVDKVERGSTIWKLGPARQVFGSVLSIRLKVSGKTLGYSWTLIHR
jgi:hypothetical protein